MTTRTFNEYLVDQAINIAARSEDMSHLVRVASRFSGGSVRGLAGWLHDSVEDGYSNEAEITALFGSEVAKIVMIVSRKDGETYDDFITRIMYSRNDDAIAVKIADVKVNLARAKVDRFSLVARYEKALRRLESTGVTNNILLDKKP